jgi:LacI family transcriptional regulator
VCKFFFFIIFKYLRELKKKRSIHDIARELKLSAATISFVLNGKAKENRIKPETEKKVLEYIKKVEYQRNRFAQGLRTGKSNTIGLLVEDISDSFFSAIARIIEEDASTVGYTIFNASTENDPEKIKNLLKVFRERQVDGYIIAPTPGIEGQLQQLIDDKIPLVLFDRYFPGLPSYNVVVDNASGTYMATRHLFDNGSSHIGLITLDSDQIQMCDRLTGYLKLLDENKRQPNILKISYDSTQDQKNKKIKAFLQRHPHLDGLVFATNYLTLSGLEVLKEMGYSIPSDMAVVGFDDNTHFKLISPAVSAIAQPIEEMSKKVIDQLIRRLSDEDKIPDKDTIMLPTRLIVRESSVRKPVNRNRNVVVNDITNVIEEPKTQR